MDRIRRIARILFPVVLLFAWSSPAIATTKIVEPVSIPDPLEISAIDFTPGSAPAYVEGRVYYDEDDDTLTIYSSVSDVALQIGQEMWVKVVNKTGLQIDNGKVVYINGAQGNRPTVALADADASVTADSTIGVLTHDCADNAECFITTSGLVRDFDTTGGGEAWAAGQELWVSSTAGDFTDVEPVSPSHAIMAGYVIAAHASQGVVLVAIKTGSEIDGLHDAHYPIATAANQILQWDSVDLRWENILAPVFGGDVSPSGDAVYDLGTLSKRWEFGHINRLRVTDIDTPSAGRLTIGGSNALPTAISSGLEVSLGNLTIKDNVGPSYSLVLETDTSGTVSFGLSENASPVLTIDHSNASGSTQFLESVSMDKDATDSPVLSFVNVANDVGTLFLDDTATSSFILAAPGRLDLTGANAVRIYEGGNQITQYQNTPGGGNFVTVYGQTFHASSINTGLVGEGSYIGADGLHFEDGSSNRLKLSIETQTGNNTQSFADVSGTIGVYAVADVNCADTGDGSACTADVTPTAHDYQITSDCLDANGCVYTMKEDGADLHAGQMCTLICGSTATGSCSMAVSAGVSHISGAWSASAHDSITLRYSSDSTWVEVGRSDNQ